MATEKPLKIAIIAGEHNSLAEMTGNGRKI